MTAEPADAVDAFLRLSAALTGFDRMELLGTGMVPRYYDELTQIIGAREVGTLLAAAGRVEPGHPASGEDLDRAFREQSSTTTASARWPGASSRCGTPGRGAAAQGVAQHLRRHVP